MDKIQLLKAIYRSLRWEKLYELAPELDRETVDEFFIEMREMLQSREGAAEKHQKLRLFCDGASRGNPGPAAAGIVLQDAAGREVFARGSSIGKATNNVAEYRALIQGLKKAEELGAGHVAVFSDSQLLVRQIKGSYRVKSSRLKDLYREARELLEGFDSWKIHHVPRELNARADSLAQNAARSG